MVNRRIENDWSRTKKPRKANMLDAVYNFVNSMIEESTYCSELIKKHFNKELVMTIKDDKDIKNSVKR